MLKAKDTFFHGYIWWAAGDTEFQLYDLLNGYDVKLKDKTVIKSSYHVSYPMVYTASAINIRPRWGYFFHPKEVDTTYWALFNDSTKLLNDTNIAGTPCWHIIRKPEDDEPYMINIVKHFYVSKIDYTVMLEVCNSISFGMPYYSYFLMANEEFDKVKKEDFSASQIPKDFQVKDYSDKKYVMDSTDKEMSNYIFIFNTKKTRDYQRQKIY